MKARSVLGMAVLASVLLVLGAGPALAGTCDDYDKEVVWGDPVCNCEAYESDLRKWNEEDQGTHDAEWDGGSCEAYGSDGHVETEAQVDQPWWGWIPFGVWAKAYASVQGTQTITWKGEGSPPTATATAKAGGKWWWKGEADGNGGPTGGYCEGKASGAAMIEPGQPYGNHWEASDDWDHPPGESSGGWLDLPWLVTSTPEQFQGSVSFYLTIAAYSHAVYVDSTGGEGEHEASAASQVNGGFKAPTIVDP
jgi:hypothetical protein